MMLAHTQAQSPQAGARRPQLHARLAEAGAGRRPAVRARRRGIMVGVGLMAVGTRARRSIGRSARSKSAGSSSASRRCRSRRSSRRSAAPDFSPWTCDALRAALESIPWIDRARVERRWPNGVRVFITEHVPAAIWGEDGLMNTRGELFLRRCAARAAGAAATDRPGGTEAQVAQLYLETYPRLLAVGMRLTQRRARCARRLAPDTDNGVEVRLGRHDVDSLDRFIASRSPHRRTRGEIELRRHALQQRLLAGLERSPHARSGRRTRDVDARCLETMTAT